MRLVGKILRYFCRIFKKTQCSGNSSIVIFHVPLNINANGKDEWIVFLFSI